MVGRGALAVVVQPKQLLRADWTVTGTGRSEGEHDALVQPVRIRLHRLALGLTRRIEVRTFRVKRQTEEATDVLSAVRFGRVHVEREPCPTPTGKGPVIEGLHFGGIGRNEVVIEGRVIKLDRSRWRIPIPIHGAGGGIGFDLKIGAMVIEVAAANIRSVLSHELDYLERAPRAIDVR